MGGWCAAWNAAEIDEGLGNLQGGAVGWGWFARDVAAFAEDGMGLRLRNCKMVNYY